MEKLLEKEIKNELNKKSGYIYENKYVIKDIQDNYCKLEGTIDETSLNPYGIVHGGYIFGLADTAGGIAISTTGRVAVTTNSSILFLHKADCNKLIAIAKVIKVGKELANCEVDIYDENNNMIAKVLLEYFFINS